MYNSDNIIFRESLYALRAYDLIEGYWLGDLILSEVVEHDRYKDKCNGDKLLKIVRIEVSSRHTNEGVATLLINELIKRHPQYNFYLLCHPMPRGECDEKHKTVKDLRRFYSKFGFVPCGELLPTMIRKAKI